MPARALRFRRGFLVVAPLIAAVLMVAGVFLDPDIDESGTELAQACALWTPVAVTVGLFLAQALQPLGSGLLIAAVAMAGLSYAFWKLDWRGDAAPAATLSG